MGKTPHNKCLVYKTNLSDGKASALELRVMWSTSLLPLLPRPLRFGVLALDRVLSMDQIEIFNNLTQPTKPVRK